MNFPNPNKKSIFRVQSFNVIKPKKHYFFIGEKHFDNWNDERAMTEFIRLLQKSIIKNLYHYTVEGHNILVHFQDKLDVYSSIEEIKSAGFLEEKKFGHFVVRYFYRGVLGIIEILIIFGIQIFKVTALALEKVGRSPLLTFLFFFILLAWVFSKWKKVKKKNNDPNNDNEKEKRKKK